LRIGTCIHYRLSSVHLMAFEVGVLALSVVKLGSSGEGTCWLTPSFKKGEFALINYVELIAKKRDGYELSTAEIEQLIVDFTAGRFPDYQMSALAMAIYHRGLSDKEMRTWTRAMLHSGRVLDLSELGPGRIDKHSTGGVGDKISLPLAPAAAACGVIVPMVAGRGLGHTGGTVDKLESIPGYRADLTVAQFVERLKENGCSIIGQTAEIAPADRRLYHLRDVTATVEIMELITASIMSKKLAEGIEGLVLDVKVGSAAFMKNLEEARALAEAMVSVGEGMGTRVIAFLTRMEEPLGRMIGNANEVRESIDILKGEGPDDVRELVVTLGGAMVELAKGHSQEDGRQAIADSLDNGRAFDVWNSMLEGQGGDISKLPKHELEIPVVASRDGVVQRVNGLEIGLTGVALGAGRSRSDQEIDPVVGIRMEVRRGSEVRKGDALATILLPKTEPSSPEVIERLANAFELGDDPVEPKPLIIDRIG
jgi:pyrimidine-nucleoside phosphorylase